MDWHELQVGYGAELILILPSRKYAHTQNFLTFIIYIYGIFLQNFMRLGDCVQN